MADPRYRYSGRRSPTFNPARASMPLSVEYSSMYGGDIHAIPTGRYEPGGSRRSGDHRPTTTITTYQVNKGPFTRSSSVRDHSRTRHRSSTLEPGGHVKPIIVTTNHASRPHNSSSHNSSGTGRTRSPSREARDPYRSSDDAYYTQPASSMQRSRSHQRHHSQSATMDNDEFYRLRERVGDERLRAPRAGTGEDSYHPYSRRSLYAHTPRISSGVVDLPAEGYEYTKPSDLARYDLDNDQPRTRGRRESFDRSYYRPSVNVINSDLNRLDSRRGPPPPSAGLERYNRAAADRHAAAGIYDRPTVTMPTLPVVPPPPTVDPARRSGLLDPPVSPTVDRRSSGRPRPVSLYQDAPPRMSQPDEIYRARDEDHRAHRERELYRDDPVVSRGYGIRPELLEQPDVRRQSESTLRDYDDRRTRREYDEREPKRRSDEELHRVRGRDERRIPESKERPPCHNEEHPERKDIKDSGRGEKVRDKVAAGLGAAAAAIGLGAVSKDTEDHRDGKGSPKRRGHSDEDLEPMGSRAADKYKPREKDMIEREPSREDPIIVEHKRELKKDMSDSREDFDSRERERERERDRDRDWDRERERERERERNYDKERSRRDTDTKLNGSREEPRDNSPPSDDTIPRRRRRGNSAAFNPTDTKGLMDLKAQLAALDQDGQDRPKEEKPARDRGSEADTIACSSSERQTAAPRDWDDSRGRELVPVDSDSKQVRVLSPPRDKSDQKPIKGILKQPKEQFPEEPNPVREGVAPHKDDKKAKDVPPGARWTKINRKMVNPEALTIGKERFEVRDDFVIVLRVLNKEEIQGYATATAQLRERRRKELEGDTDDRDSDERPRERERDRERDREDDERRRRRHREGQDDDDDRRERDRFRRQ